MSGWRDVDDEMERTLVDHDAEDRLLAGTLPADELPPGFAEVAAVLEAARAESEGWELAREFETVAAMAAVLRSQATTGPTQRRSRMPSMLLRPRMAFALASLVLAAASGAALGGALPAPAEGVVSTVLDKLGISLPERAGPGGAPNNKGSEISNLARTTEATGVDKGAVVSTAASNGKSRAGTRSGHPAGGPHADTKGSVISQLAHTTDAVGVEKGAAISTAASGGKSQAGMHGAGGRPAEKPPVETPNAGGSGTADVASGGASSAGTAKGDAASGGASSAGAGNRP